MRDAFFLWYIHDQAWHFKLAKQAAGTLLDLTQKDVCILTTDKLVPEEQREDLQNLGCKIYTFDPILPTWPLNFHWKYEITKMRIFQILGYDRIIALDTDQYPRGNIDEMFDTIYEQNKIYIGVHPIIPNTCNDHYMAFHFEEHVRIYLWKKFCDLFFNSCNTAHVLNQLSYHGSGTTIGILESFFNEYLIRQDPEFFVHGPDEVRLSKEHEAHE